MGQAKQIIILAGLLILATTLGGSAGKQGWCIEEDSSFGLYETGERLEKLQIYFETEMYEEALALLDELLVQFPDEPRFEYLKAIVNYQRQDYDNASRVFIKFIKKYPDIAEPYYLLGEINLKKGNKDEAKRYLSRYCELVPEDYDAQHKLNSISSEGLLVIFIIEDGREDSQLVEKVGFYGACVHSYEEEWIKLVNGSFCSWSSMGIDFVYPLDLRGKRIIFKLKGKQGGERLELTFRDKFSKSYNPQLVLMPEERLLPNWHQIKVTLDDHQRKIDLSSVVHMGLEFGLSTVQNPPNSTLFVKDIFIENAHN